jgi:hypothetical protein
MRRSRGHKQSRWGCRRIWVVSLQCLQRCVRRITYLEILSTVPTHKGLSRLARQRLWQKSRCDKPYLLQLGCACVPTHNLACGHVILQQCAHHYPSTSSTCCHQHWQHKPYHQLLLCTSHNCQIFQGRRPAPDATFKYEPRPPLQGKEISVHIL